MKLLDWWRSPTGVDPVRVAGTFGALAGVGSLLAPYWTGLAEALCAVAAVGWAARVRDDRRGAGARWGPGVALAGAAALALVVGPAGAGVRGALLGAAAAVVAVAVARPPAYGEAGP